MSRTGCFIANLKHLFTACLPLKTNCKMLTINAEIKSDGKRLDGTYNVNSENSELALVKLMELFNHSSLAITKRYLGLRQEEILQTYDCLSF